MATVTNPNIMMISFIHSFLNMYGARSMQPSSVPSARDRAVNKVPVLNELTIQLEKEKQHVSKPNLDGDMFNRER